MKTSYILGVSLLLGSITTASASLSYIDEDGDAVAGPAVIDSTKEAIYFSESIDGLGNGQYTVTNNTVDYGLIAFGISNTDTEAWIGSAGIDFGCEFSWCYSASNLDASNWALESIDFGGTTGQSKFGDISNVLDSGENTLNFYKAVDGDLQSGDSWDKFIFNLPVPASQLFIVLSGSSGTLYASGGQAVNAVPVPAAAWLMMSGLIGLVGIARHRKV